LEKKKKKLRGVGGDPKEKKKKKKKKEKLTKWGGRGGGGNPVFGGLGFFEPTPPPKEKNKTPTFPPTPQKTGPTHRKKSKGWGFPNWVPQNKPQNFWTPRFTNRWGEFARLLRAGGKGTFFRREKEVGNASRGKKNGEESAGNKPILEKIE